MRKSIVRTMTTSTIKAFLTKVENGKPVIDELEPLSVMGKCSEKEALKALREKHGKTSAITISSIVVSEEVYEISVADFIKYAKKVEKSSDISEPVSEASETK